MASLLGPIKLPNFQFKTLNYCWLASKTKSAIFHRFKTKVQIGENCWRWTSAIQSEGYGVLSISKKTFYAHRLSVKFSGREIPNGEEVDHLCRNRWCVNPSHLDVVTHQTNVLRGNSPCAETIRRGRCKNGHALIGANIYVRKDGMGKQCKECSDNRNRQRRTQKKEIKKLSLRCAECGLLGRRWSVKRQIKMEKFCSIYCCGKSGQRNFRIRHGLKIPKWLE